MAFPSISKDSFIGTIDLSVGVYDERFQPFIEAKATEYRRLLCGQSLFKAITDADPLPLKYQDFLHGATYTSWCNQDDERYFEGFNKVILNLCYFEWIRLTLTSYPTGMRKNNTENASDTPNTNMVLAIRSYNEASRWWEAGQEFILAANSKRLKVLAVNGLEVTVEDLLYLEEGDKILTDELILLEAISIDRQFNIITTNIAASVNTKTLGYKPFPMRTYDKLHIMV